MITGTQEGRPGMAKLADPYHGSAEAAVEAHRGPLFQSGTKNTPIGRREFDAAQYGTSYATDIYLNRTAINGRTLTLPVPASGDLDVLLFTVSPTGSATISSVSSTAGASWSAPAGSNGSYTTHRIASGGEPATVTVVATDNTPISVSWQRWK
jgi:hypothetical protein